MHIEYKGLRVLILISFKVHVKIKCYAKNQLNKKKILIKQYCLLFVSWKLFKQTKINYTIELIFYKSI